jgi:hypothetical protein
MNWEYMKENLQDPGLAISLGGRTGNHGSIVIKRLKRALKPFH